MLLVETCLGNIKILSTHPQYKRSEPSSNVPKINFWIFLLFFSPSMQFTWSCGYEVVSHHLKCNCLRNMHFTIHTKITSGATNSGVPQSTLMAVPGSSSLAVPKSMIFTVVLSFWVHTTFSGWKDVFFLERVGWILYWGVRAGWSVCNARPLPLKGFCRKVLHPFFPLNPLYRWNVRCEKSWTA